MTNAALLKLLLMPETGRNRLVVLTRDVLEELEAFNPSNWAEKCEELGELLRGWGEQMTNDEGRMKKAGMIPGLPSRQDWRCKEPSASYCPARELCSPILASSQDF